jgi:dihydrofolate reductase
MRLLKVIEYVTLDGVIEDPGPAGDFKHRGWTVPYWNDEMAAAQSKELFASDALLLGRVTYDEFVASWPLRSGDPFTDKMNSMKKFVATRDAAKRLEWNATPLEGDAVEAVKRLKQEPGGDILIYGSGALVRSLGEGKRLFDGDTKAIELDLLGASTTQKGVTLLTYGRRESH